MASKTKLKTRKSNEVFLIGKQELNTLSDSKQLPTVRKVLQRFHFFFANESSIRNASHHTIEEVVEVWSRAAIPTIIHCHIVTKLEKFDQQWRLLKKNKSRQSTSQREREAKFCNEIDLLFDIAPQDANEKIRIDEDRRFLEDQRGSRQMYIEAKDKALERKQKRTEDRKFKEEKRRMSYLANQDPAASTSTAIANDDQYLSDQLSVSSETDTEDDSVTFQNRQSGQSQSQFKSDTTKLFTPNVTAALDRNKITDREAVRIMVPIASALGHNPEDLPLSRSTLRRKRKLAREEHSKLTKIDYSPEFPLTVHFDGKLLPEMCGAGQINRLPVLVSGDGTEKLLGVPKLASGTGENEANAVFKLLQEWELIDHVEAMSFDTTSGNTGQWNGACTNLEKKVGRELLWLACRHHVLEIILAKVFEICLGPSCSPEIPLFKRFKAVWGGIVTSDFNGFDDFNDSELNNLRTETIRYLSSSVKQCRDDYQELIELTLVILNNPPARIHWRAPGPVHHARWMAKLLYALKIYLFREQRDTFKLTKGEEKGIERFVKFGALVYSKAWVLAPQATEAAHQDLILWRALKSYSSEDKDISKEATKVLERHLWYLSEETVGLALFSKEVSLITKEEMVKAMQKKSPSAVRKVRGNPEIINLKDVSLASFATEKSLQLLTKLKIGKSFLKIEPTAWNDNADFKCGLERVQTLKVVNDTAERGVKLFEEFNQLITKDEEEKQFLLQVVESNRKAVPTQITKKAAVDALN